MNKTIVIRAEWDEHTRLWTATSDDVPGLEARADTIDALTSQLESVVPELLKRNVQMDLSDIPDLHDLIAPLEGDTYRRLFKTRKTLH